VIPKTLVATAPEVPSVAPHDFYRRKIDAAIHWLENVGSDLRKIDGTFAGCFRFIDRLIFHATGKRKQRARDEIVSDSVETEKIGASCQQYLHRTIIDTLVGRFLARKF
jgi:hypothetical protein